MFNYLQNYVALREYSSQEEFLVAPARILSAAASALWQRSVNGTEFWVTERSELEADLSKLPVPTCKCAQVLMSLPFHPSYRLDKTQRYPRSTMITKCPASSVSECSRGT